MSAACPESPIPIHPEDQKLPRSYVRLELPSGKVAGFDGLPIQGVRTVEALIAILQIWRPTIVRPEYPITLYNPGLAAWQTGAWSK